MKRLFLAVLLLTMAWSGMALAEDKELRIFTWSEYMDEPKMSADFEAATGIKVKIDVYENNEDMIAKLQAGGISQYDIIIPSSYVLPTLNGLNLIQPLDHAKIPNIGNIMPQFRNLQMDKDNRYTVPWQWGTVGIMYNKKKVSPEAAASWSIIFDPAKHPGSFWLMDDVRTSMNAALAYLGFPMNSTNPEEIKKAVDLLTMIKNSKNCSGFKTGVGGKNDVVAGTADLAVVFNGDAIRDVSENPEKFGFVVPKEGGEVWVDLMAIPAEAPHPDAAHAWINWILEPKVGAELSNYNRYATPNQASLPFILPEDL
jgi:spermidine/putrescine transport system substrate-binding protein